MFTYCVEVMNCHNHVYSLFRGHARGSRIVSITSLLRGISGMQIVD